MVDLGDPSLIFDLRHLNPGRISRYEEFWEAAAQYIADVAETAVDDRRHDPVLHLATAMSTSHLLKEVKKRLDVLAKSEVPCPSEQWLRLQFWPADPSRRSSLQYTGRLKIKYQVQARQIRKQHEDAHYCSALLKYLKEMAVLYRSHTTFVSMDDKHKVSLADTCACSQKANSTLHELQSFKTKLVFDNYLDSYLLTI